MKATQFTLKATSYESNTGHFESNINMKARQVTLKATHIYESNTVHFESNEENGGRCLLLPLPLPAEVYVVRSWQCFLLRSPFFAMTC
jgi:hypothetical protein